MKKIFKRIAIAFSIYSRIPMPTFKWDEEDTGHAAAFMPFIGFVIGLLEYLAYLLFKFVDFPEAVMLGIYTLIPLLVTGGFHVDGFLDVEDALQSYKDKEEKLKILKDPHIGAFAVIRFATLSAFWIVGMSLLVNGNSKVVLPFCLMFATIRALAGLLAQILPHAKKDGMLNSETSGNKADKVMLAIELVLCLVAVAVFDWKACVIFIAGLLVETFCFSKSMNKNFGGVTGDTIGYFVVKTETVILLLIGIYAFVGMQIL